METGKNNQRTNSIFYASPLIFLAASGLLVLIIGVFAVNNYQREKRLNELILKQEATAILNLVAAGSRSALRRGLMRGELDENNWLDFFSQTIENSAEHPGLLGLYLVDQNGTIRTHSDTKQIGVRVDEQALMLLKQQQETRQRTISSIVNHPEMEEPVFMMAMTFQPAAAMDGSQPAIRGRMGRMRQPQPGGLPEHLENMRTIAAAPLTLVVELSLEGYQQAIRKQILQVVVLSLVLLLVGGGGLLSLVLIQNYKGSQRRLKSIHSFTDTLVASLPLGLIATTEEGLIKACNPSAAQMLNIEADGCLDRELSEVLDSKILEDLKLHQQKQIHRWVMATDIESGMERNLLFTRVKIENEDEQAGGVMLLVQDLSHIRHLEDQLQRAEQEAVVGRMAAGVAHELRNPLSSVKGLTLLLKSRFKDDLSTQETADLMVEQVERLDRSISELLDYARPSQTSKSMVRVDELLAKAVMLVRSDAETQRIAVEEHFGCGTTTTEGDRDKLTQLFLNLFLNAIQAMEDGGRLSVSTRCTQEEIIIEISDSGCGIPSELVEKVFEPYFTTKQDGTGLGLAMSTKIVQDHHGRMTLESTEKAGTTVTVRLPVH
jgi:two-component system sensor histidine kinase HydH